MLFAMSKLFPELLPHPGEEPFLVLFAEQATPRMAELLVSYRASPSCACRGELMHLLSAAQPMLATLADWLLTNRNIDCTAANAPPVAVVRPPRPYTRLVANDDQAVLLSLTQGKSLGFAVQIVPQADGQLKLYFY